jgi:hypothetical protein
MSRMAHAVSLSCSPLSHTCSSLPKSHIGVAHSGASSFYFSKRAPVTHLNTSAPRIQVKIANTLKPTKKPEPNPLVEPSVQNMLTLTPPNGYLPLLFLQNCITIILG